MSATITIRLEFGRLTYEHKLEGARALLWAVGLLVLGAQCG